MAFLAKSKLETAETQLDVDAVGIGPLRQFGIRSLDDIAIMFSVGGVVVQSGAVIANGSTTAFALHPLLFSFFASNLVFTASLNTPSNVRVLNQLRVPRELMVFGPADFV